MDKISLVYNSYVSNNGNLVGQGGRPQSNQAQKTPPKPAPIPDQRFKSPGFRRAVRLVLSHFGYAMTMGNFYKHAKAANLTSSEHWYKSAAIIGNSSKPAPLLADGSTPVSGVFIETSTGNLIDMGVALNSIKELTEYNRRLKK